MIKSKELLELYDGGSGLNDGLGVSFNLWIGACN